MFFSDEVVSNTNHVRIKNATFPYLKRIENNKFKDTEGNVYFFPSTLIEVLTPIKKKSDFDEFFVQEQKDWVKKPIDLFGFDFEVWCQTEEIQDIAQPIWLEFTIMGLVDNQYQRDLLDELIINELSSNGNYDDIFYDIEKIMEKESYEISVKENDGFYDPRED